MDASADSMFFDDITHLLSMLCIFIKILPHARVKKKTKRLKGLKFYFNGSSLAVKGLIMPRNGSQFMPFKFKSH